MKSKMEHIRTKERPWKMRDSFTIGTILIAAGLVLQFCVGPIQWGMFSWPVNMVVLGLLILLILFLHISARRFQCFRFLGTMQAAVPSIGYALALTIVMGLSHQEPDGSGVHHMLTFWPFVLTYVYMTIILGLVVVKKVRTKLSAFLFHLGLFITLVTATMGNADMHRVHLIALKGQTEWRAVDEEKRVVELPLSVNLQKFIMEEYDDGSPSRFASDIMVYTRQGKAIHAIVDVNKPIRIEGWKIYQYSYDTEKGALSGMSIFELVRDPWLPAVYAGFGLMMLGAIIGLLSSFVRGKESNWRHSLRFSVFLGILIILCWKGFSIPSQLPPALQSPWFIPHIAAYIVAYSLLGAATLKALWKRGKSVDNLVCAGFSLLTFGMLFGAIWAKEAWGHYWTWDPKETWAAITWMAYLVYFHYHRTPHCNERIARGILVVAFCLLQMCWWGIRLLPSAVGNSIHVYD